MKLLKWLVILLLTGFVAGCLFGCQVKGHRTITFSAFGQTITFSDKAELNDEGKAEYSADLTDEWKEPVINRLFEPPAAEDGDGPDAEDGSGD